MAISPSIGVSQSSITPFSVTVEDTSQGTYGTITKRRIYVSDAYGDYLTGNGTVDYDDWALADTTITLDILDGSTAANIRVDWLDVSNVVIESYNNNYPLSAAGKQFLFQLVSSLGLTPGEYMDTNFATNLATYLANLQAGDNAVTYGNDISGAQNCYNRCIEMEQNQSKYF